MRLLTTIELDECGSTNNEAWAYAPGPALILTNRQTSGRGRQGRRWEADHDGNVMASLMMAAPLRHLSWIPLAAGVSAIEAMTQTIELFMRADLSGLRLKWPNDIMWNDAKMGGILCESRILGERSQGVVVGLGLNFTHAPQLETTKTAAFLSTVLAKEPRPTPAILSASKRFFTHTWATRLLAWSKELEHERTAILQSNWNAYARLEAFQSLSMHDRDGKIVRLRPVALDATGKLKAVREDDPDKKILLLDQADTF